TDSSRTIPIDADAASWKRSGNRWEVRILSIAGGEFEPFHAAFSSFSSHASRRFLPSISSVPGRAPNSPARPAPPPVHTVRICSVPDPHDDPISIVRSHRAAFPLRTSQPISWHRLLFAPVLTFPDARPLLGPCVFPPDFQGIGTLAAGNPPSDPQRNRNSRIRRWFWLRSPFPKERA